MVEEGKVIPFKEPEPQKGAKMARRAQKKSSSDRVLVEKDLIPTLGCQSGTPLLELDGAPLPLDSSIREF